MTRSATLPATDLRAAQAMVDRLRRATWDELGRLPSAYHRTWKHLPYGGVPKGRLPTQPDNKWVPEARDIALKATLLVQFRIPEIEPRIDATYAWVDAGYAPMLWAIGDAVFAVGVRSILSTDDYDQLTAPWRTVFGEVIGDGS